MKYIFFFIIAISFYSCKKGENDPFLSLRSRTNRLVGEWKVTMEEESRTIISSIGKSTYQMNFDGAIKNIIATNESEGTTSNFSFEYTQTYTFKKDGTFLIKTSYPLYDKISEGTWNFLKKNKTEKTKNKECIYLIVSKYSYTGTQPTGSVVSQEPEQISIGYVVNIDELTNKKIVLINDYTSNNIGAIENKGIFKTTLNLK